jgi:hypothetical protein
LNHLMALCLGWTWQQAKGIWVLLHSGSGTGMQYIVKESTETVLWTEAESNGFGTVSSISELIVAFPTCFFSLCLLSSFHAIVGHFLHRKQLKMEVMVNTNSLVNDRLVVY